MKRRQFNQTVGWLAASVSIGPAMCQEQGRSRRFAGRIRKAIKFAMIKEPLSVEDKFRLVKDLGFDGVETRVALKPELADIIRQYRRASDKTGLPIHGVIHSANPTLIEAIDQAKTLGANSVLHVVRANPEAGYFDNYRQTTEVVKRAVDHAEKNQVMILCENVWASYLIDPEAMAKFVDQFNSPMVGIYFDVGNVVRWGWPHHWLEVIGERAKKLDIKEYDLAVAMNEGMRKGFDTPLGSGSIDWSKVRRELANINYKGWATAEVRGGDRKRLAEIADQMNAVLDL